MRLGRMMVAAAGLAGMAGLTVSAQRSGVQTKTSQSTGKPEYTLQARVPLTILDVVVTDAKGHPVHGLKQSDFTVLEDKVEMKPNSFEEHRTDLQPAQSPALVVADQPSVPNTFTNNNAAKPSDRPINVLLIDSLNTPVQEQGMVEKQMLAFVDKMTPGTRMAVMGLSTHLFILQGITSDPELLKAAILNKKILPTPSAFEDPMRDIMDGAAGGPSWIIVDREGEQSAVRGQYMLTSMRQIARYLSGMPGRKNLIWFTGSFPLQFPPFIDNVAFPPPPGVLMRPQSYDFDADMKSATDQLARAHVAVYPIDAHGLEAMAPPTNFKSKNVNYMNLVEHGTMDTIAEQTGGKAFYNTNGFVEAVEDALDSGSNYYTLTYTPTNQNMDTRFRTISVKVDQPGVKLVYRDGYYAVDPGTTLSGKRLETVTPMQSALMRGTLEPTQILFSVKIDEAPSTGDALPDGNKPDAKMKPPYRRYTISYVINVNGIDFAAAPDGNYRGEFEYGVNVFNADGDELVNSVSKEVSPILLPAVYQSMLRGGANAHQEVAVPAKGEYFLRIAVHDLTSDRVGAIEVPVSSITPDVVSAAVPGK